MGATKSSAKKIKVIPKSKKIPKKANIIVKKTKISAKFKKEIKATLINMRELILDDISKLIKDESNHLKHDVGDFYDSASNDRERELSLLLNQRDRQKLIMIEESLARIESGNYGKCIPCEELIEEDRLRAMPFTRYCVSCLEEEEESNNNL